MTYSGLKLVSAVWGRYLVVLVLAAWLVGLIMFPSNPLKRLPERDNGVFLYGGQQILLGKIPYVDFWDHKGPLIHYLNALGLFLGRGLRWGVWALEFGFLISTALGMYLVTRRTWGSFAGLAAMAAWALFFSRAGPYPFRDSNYTENYSLLFAVLTVAIWITARRKPGSAWLYVPAGILCGLNFLLRPNSVAPQIAITLVELIEGLRSGRPTQSLQRLGLLFLSSAVPLGIYLMWSGWRGGLPEFIDAVFVYNLFYSQSGEYGLRAYLVKGITGLAWIPVAMYLSLLALLLRGPSDPAKTTVAGTFGMYLLIAWPLEALLSSGAGRVYPHHFNTWTPYLGWLTASVVVFTPSRWRRQIDHGAAIALPLLLLALLGAGNLSTAGGYLRLAYRIGDRGARHIEAISPIVRYVTVHTDPGDSVLVWGNEVWINFLSSRPSPTKYAYQYPLFMPGYADAGKVDVFLRGLRHTAPRLIVEPRNADLREVIPLSMLLEQDDLVAQWGLPSELNKVAAYIRGNYCVEAVLKEAVVYHAISDTSSECAANERP